MIILQHGQNLSPNLKMKNIYGPIFLLILIFVSSELFAQKSADEIAKQLSNPVASLISVPLQFNFQFNINGKNGGENGYKMLLNLQPVIPMSLGRKINLIHRVIVPLSTQKDVTGKNEKEEGIGDIVYEGFFSPVKSKIIWGIGPIASFPTASNDALGSKKLLLGPAVLVLGQPGKWTIGTLGYQAWTVAGDKDRADVNIGYLQPFISYGFDGGLTVGVASENTYDWKNKRLSSGLATIILSQVFKIAGKQTASIALQPLGYYANANVSKPQWGVRVAFTLVFPQ